MTTDLFITVMMFFLAIGPILDHITTSNFKEKIQQNILSIDRRSFSNYVAGISKYTYEKILGSNFLSWSFFLRSMLLSCGFFAIQIIFLYKFYPSTFFAATSFFRLNFLSGNLFCMAVFAPTLSILFFDYSCNGQTKYFLGLMKDAPRIPNFVLLGYADFLVTFSVGVISISLALTLFIYFIINEKIEDIRIDLDFSQLENIDSNDRSRMGNYYPNMDIFKFMASYKYSSFEEETNKRDVFLSEKYPHLPNGLHISNDFDENGSRVIRFVNASNIVVDYIHEGEVRDVSVVAPITKSDSSVENFCKAISNAPFGEKFRIRIWKGWNSNEVYNSCVKRGKCSVVFTASVEDKFFDYLKLFTRDSGEFVGLSLRSIISGFKEYYADGPALIFKIEAFWTEPYLIGDDKGVEAYFSTFLGKVWSAKFGGYRVFETYGFPWSTFFISTLMTSSFIWIVIALTSAAYPVVWMLEKVGNRIDTVKINEYPCTFIAVVFCVYLAIMFFII